MFLVIFLIVFSVGMFAAYRLLWPEMYVKLGRPEFNFIWKKTQLREDITHDRIEVDVPLRDEPSYVETPKEAPVSYTGMEKIHKLESLLLEKNKIIDRMQTQIDNERSHRKDFENVKAIMDEEIKHLREQLRAFRNYYKEKADA